MLIGFTKAYKIWASGCAFCIFGTSKVICGTTSGFYRIYWELELDLRIKPRRRLVWEKPDELVVPAAPNKSWSMDLNVMTQ